MTSVATEPQKRRWQPPWPAALDRRFEAVVFDWDGTAVPDRAADASHLRELIEELCALGLDLAVITGTHVGNVDGQLGARPAGPGRLLLGMNRGSELYRADAEGLHLVERREATAEEDAALDAAAQATVREPGATRHRGRDRLPTPQPAQGRPHSPGRVARPSEGTDRRAPRRRGGAPGGGRAPRSPRGRRARRLRCARLAGVADPRVTSDAKHVEIGLTDKADAAARVFAELAQRGIAPGVVLVAGDEFGPLGGLPGSDSLLLVPEAQRSTAVSVGREPTGAPATVLSLGGGPERFVALLEDQLERRKRGDVPDVDDDPAWSIAFDGLDPKLERVHESLLTIADGRIGTRGTPLLADRAADPAVLVSWGYVGEGPESELAQGPDWTALRGRLDGRALGRRLDLRTGLLRHDGTVEAVQLSSRARPGVVALRAQARERNLPPPGRRMIDAPRVSAALVDSRRPGRLDRLAAYAADERAAGAALAAAEEAGFEHLLVEHRAAWARRWATADVVVEGDPDLQLAIRFTLFHLMASVAEEERRPWSTRALRARLPRTRLLGQRRLRPAVPRSHAPALGARDARVPDSRLNAARTNAARLGYEGARFPWESAEDGLDVTPTHAHLPTGEIARIRTGEAEEHITADVVWAAATYVDWTGDEEFARGPARELFVETARYWASRVRVVDGRAHLYGVIGPDEYHEPVDDNAFTNVMARWNLRRGAELVENAEERATWLAIADALVDGYDPMSGLYEQFAGFFRLELLVIADIAPRRPIAADLLLGRDRTAAAQVLKQADVVMLHQLVPDEVAPGSLLPNLDYYEPRTAHGSSLSPAIHAGLFARAGRFRDALQALRIAARIDLDDLTGSTASGLHLATMGGLWQALVFGFAGVRPRGDSLVVDPRLPPEWGALELNLCFRGSPLRLRIDRSGVELAAGDELELRRREGMTEVVFR